MNNEWRWSIFNGRTDRVLSARQTQRSVKSLCLSPESESSLERFWNYFIIRVVRIRSVAAPEQVHLAGISRKTGLTRNSSVIHVVTPRFRTAVPDGAPWFSMMVVMNCVVCDLTPTTCKTSRCVGSVHSKDTRCTETECRALCWPSLSTFI